MEFSRKECAAADREQPCVRGLVCCAALFGSFPFFAKRGTRWPHNLLTGRPGRSERRLDDRADDARVDRSVPHDRRALQFICQFVFRDADRRHASGPYSTRSRLAPRATWMIRTLRPVPVILLSLPTRQMRLSLSGRALRSLRQICLLALAFPIFVAVSAAVVSSNIVAQFILVNLNTGSVLTQSVTEAQ